MEYDAQAVVKKAFEDEEEWRMRKEGQPQPNHLPAPKNQRNKWTPPPQGWFKCNTDGAWRSENTKSGMGWILQDHMKKAIWIGARALPRANSVLEVEAESLRWAILSLLRLDYRKVIFETDSQQLVSLLKGEAEKLQLQPILHDIIRLIQRFEEVKILFIYRDANGVADRIAKESILFSNYDSKLYSIMPNWVKSFMDGDNV